ncbi:MAG TPA: hypothetical protein PLS50_08240, partial [Candidatus Dojkabacteria bacterium]|nr:hypothetical protein [Candidatus Dojkabacteria bacterium]
RNGVPEEHIGYEVGDIVQRGTSLINITGFYSWGIRFAERSSGRTYGVRRRYRTAGCSQW